MWLKYFFLVFPAIAIGEFTGGTDHNKEEEG